MSGRRDPTGGLVAEHDRLTGHLLLRGRTRAGTEVRVVPMPGFTARHATLTARYGSLDTRLPDGARLPVGIAHFLEHEMFHTPEGDAFDLYAARGASANAFTTFTHTTYLFGCTKGFGENLRTLLDCVGSLDVDAEDVEREKGIIGQEIAMYRDDPSWRGYFDLMGALYRRHPARLDIAGTAGTIAPIDVDLLRRTHGAYYHPRNLLLVVAGDVDPAAVLAEAGARLKGRGAGRRNRRRPFPEPSTVARREVRARLPVSRPYVYVGLKEKGPGGGRALVHRHVESSMALEILCGDGGRIQTPLYEEGIVDEGFQAGYEAEADHAHAVISAEVDDVGLFRRRLFAALERAAREGFGAEEVERARRRILGRHLRVFDAPERAAHWMLGIAIEGLAPGAGVEAVERATPRTLARRLRALVAAPRAVSLVIPRGDGRPVAA